LPNGRVAIVLADVVGHGVAAAMLMAKLSAETRFCVATESQPKAAVTNLNTRLCGLEIDRFVTLVLVVINPRTHQATIVNAGHLPPLYRRADGRVEEVGKATAGVPLGIAERVEYKQVGLQLEPGDSLTLLTDGLPEALDRDMQQYGLQRVRQQLQESTGTSESIGTSLLADVRRHLDGRAQDDDVCLVVVRRDTEPDRAAESP
jgi:serine phosphatase RsbU (regulator of sigma subunit)